MLYLKVFGVLALTETWFVTETDQLTINELVPTGYEFNHIPSKSGRRAGGIGILYKSGLTVTVCKSETTEIYTHFVLYIVPLLLNKMGLEIQFSLVNGLNTQIIYPLSHMM